MRRTLGMVAAVGILVGLVACQPTEPAMTITAKALASKPGCGSLTSLSGTVTPATATSKVVLQRTVGGKWTDWKQLSGGTVQSGTYTVSYQVPFTRSTLHLRVRSNGGGSFSNGVYVTPTEYDTGQCG